MTDVTELNGIRLRPAIELVPALFSTTDRSPPSNRISEMPNVWEQYWRKCLAESGIENLNPVCAGSWHADTAELTESQLDKVLRVIIDDWGGTALLEDPDSSVVLCGGLVLSTQGQGVVVEPSCCGDLGDLRSWKEATSYQGNDWKMLWIGHPWLSMRFESPRLLLSQPHESRSPEERWALDPTELKVAVLVAEAELRRFSTQIAQVLRSWRYDGDIESVSSQLIGLTGE